GDHLLLLALVQGVELAVGAQDENAVDPLRDQVIQEPFEPRQVQVLVGLHGRRDGGDDASYIHGGQRSEVRGQKSEVRSQRSVSEKSPRVSTRGPLSDL